MFKYFKCHYTVKTLKWRYKLQKALENIANKYSPNQNIGNTSLIGMGYDKIKGTMESLYRGIANNKKMITYGVVTFTALAIMPGVFNKINSEIKISDYKNRALEYGITIDEVKDYMVNRAKDGVKAIATSSIEKFLAQTDYEEEQFMREFGCRDGGGI